MLKTKKLLWSIKHSDCTHNPSFAVEKVSLFDFCRKPELWMSSRTHKMPFRCLV